MAGVGAGETSAVDATRYRWRGVSDPIHSTLINRLGDIFHHIFCSQNLSSFVTHPPILHRLHLAVLEWIIVTPLCNPVISLYRLVIIVCALVIPQ